MSRRGAALAALAAGAIVTAGWQLSQAGHDAEQAATAVAATASGTGSAGSGAAEGTSADGSGSGGGAPSGSGDAAGSAGAALADGAYTGDAVATRYGEVQVEVTISGGTVSGVTALALPSRDGRSAQISQRAEPILRAEAIAASSADIANVSGATYTSEGYARSLQSALDEAAG